MLKTKNVSEKNIYPKSVPNPPIHLEYNFIQNKNMNEAELNALKEIEARKKRNELRESKNKEFKKKYNEKMLSYKEEQKKKNEEEELIKKTERLELIQKMNNFNKTLQEKNMKKNIINNNNHLIWTKTKNPKSKNKSKDEKDINKNKKIMVVNHTDKNEDLVNFKSMDSNFIPKKTILKSTSFNINTINNNDFIINDITNDNNENNFIRKKTLLKSSNELFKDKIEIEDSKESFKNEEIENKNENVIDLRSNIEYMINSQFNKKQFLFNNNKEKDDIKNQINERIYDLKKFRNEGIFPEKNIQVKTNRKKRFYFNKKFLSEFEKKRFIKALKNIFTERLGEHNIYIQNICSCGNLQKQLTAIVEKGNLTVYALTEVECANNCVFYKNKKEYMKCINDVLNSIKKIKYENFHNKYK